MKYAQAKLGRIFVLKFDDKDKVLDEIKIFVRRERVKTAMMVFLGALREGALVAGPRKPVVPPLPNRIAFSGGWEVMGVATVFTNKQGPQVHMHSALGKGKKVYVGCVREKTNVFIVLEAVVWELKGIKATKDIDPVTGINLLRLS
jgi:predicted DNA-binding protein with PD1-like motif